ncbi:ankyrin repeat domain-containing protein [Dactylosporangium siamense]|uniref:Ankyrin repeat domain-containing protein n=1 Tax=Dactylosporangium siamense TaxID=685454 RepID=A0A919PWF9_9ACTN|nr:ankyrin repeat domain-containing protein [Dactylosporangium siamense]GIG49853.1 hypothetical protein Dsi01nite_078940 [Dactylosporangium siamense]
MTLDDQLRAAVASGDAAGVAAALAAGADPDALVDRERWGVLLESARAGRADLVTLLLEAGATVGGVGRYGATPLRVAAGAGHAGVVRLLVAAGASAAEPDRRQSVLGHVISEVAFQPARALLDTLDVLLELGANTGPREDPPVVAAVRASAPPAVLRILFDRGADPDQRRADGTPALVLAARLGDHAAVDLLVRAGADVDATDPRGRSALMHAVERNHRAAAAVLLLAGADRSLAAPDGTTALRLAQAWHWQNIQFALGERSVGSHDVPVARTLLRLHPGELRLEADPVQFELLASVVEAVVDGLGDDWELRSGHTGAAALAFAARLRSDQVPVPRASWHTVTASRDEVAVAWSALNESANGDTRLRAAGVSVWDVRDLAEDFFGQIPH